MFSRPTNYHDSFLGYYSMLRCLKKATKHGSLIQKFITKKSMHSILTLITYSFTHDSPRPKPTESHLCCIQLLHHIILTNRN